MKTKFSNICIIGKPNSGKSTLLNRLIGQKISITTHKAQTTRNRILGIYTKDDTQLVFIDTPGIFNASTNLEKSMVRTAWTAISGADYVVLLIDISSRRPVEEEFNKVLDYLKKSKIKVILVFNKVDNLGIKENSEINDDIFNSEKISDNFRENLKFINDKFQDTERFFISATNNINVDKFIEYFHKNSEFGEFMYSEDEITDAPQRFLAEEITREQLFLKLDKEIPYNLTVETETFEHVSKNEVKIHQIIIAKRDSHKKIILGKAGSLIKEVGQLSRKEISNCLNLKVHLFLFVKIRDDWDKKSSYYNKFGMNSPF